MKIVLDWVTRAANSYLSDADTADLVDNPLCFHKKRRRICVFRKDITASKGFEPWSWGNTFRFVTSGWLWIPDDINLLRCNIFVFRCKYCTGENVSKIRNLLWQKRSGVDTAQLLHGRLSSIISRLIIVGNISDTTEWTDGWRRF